MPTTAKIASTHQQTKSLKERLFSMAARSSSNAKVYMILHVDPLQQATTMKVKGHGWLSPVDTMKVVSQEVASKKNTPPQAPNRKEQLKRFVFKKIVVAGISRDLDLEEKSRISVLSHD